MGTQRTSNKDIAEKLDTLISILTAQAQTPVVTPAPKAQAPKAESNSYDIPKGYMERMDSKVSELVSTDGQARVLYVRKNLNGETKLAYALKSRWDAGIKDNGLIGAVKVYK